MKRFLSLTAIVLVLVVAVIGCQQAPKVLKVAVLAPLSGPVPTFGVSTRDGALLAINEWNAKGGVLGMKITPIVEDSQCTPDPAVNAANKVINQDKVHYIIGEVCSNASIPISEIANAAKVIQISPTSTNTAVTVDKNGATKAVHLPRLLHRPLPGQGGRHVRLNNLKAKKAFIMFDQGNDYVKGLAEAFEATFTAARRQDRRQGKLHRDRHRLLRHPRQGQEREARRRLPARLLQRRQPRHQAGQGKGHQRPVHGRRWLGFLGPRRQGRRRRLLHQPLRRRRPAPRGPELPQGLRRQYKDDRARPRFLTPSRPSPTTRRTCSSPGSRTRARTTPTR